MMSWTAPIFNYCERGQNPDLLAEPINAITNLSFIIAAVIAYYIYVRQPQKTHMITLHWLMFLVFAIGVGSTLFHTFANRWSALTDVLPILIFILSYLIFAMAVFLRLPWFGVLAGLALYFAASSGFTMIRCDGGPCLNGTLGYASALLALFVIGGALWIKRHPAGIPLVLAGVVFFVSATFRTLDFHLCDVVAVHGEGIGTHFLWHLLNGVTLFILLYAAILYAPNRPQKT